MSVDLKRGETLPIHVNMTFPSLPCDGKWYPLITLLFSPYFLDTSRPKLLLFGLLFVFCSIEHGCNRHVREA